MKRKLSALLAIVLVVVMVFPTAIFVGAADAPATITATFNEKDVTNGGTYEIPFASKWDLNLVVPSGYSVTYTHENNGATILKGDKGVYTVEGNRVDKTDKYTFTAESDAEGAAPITFVINFSCVAVAVSGDGLTFKITPTEFKREEPVTKDMITVSGKLNNGEDINAIVTGVKTSGTTYESSVAVIGGDEKVYFQYNITNSSFSQTGQTGEVGIIVKAPKITSVSASLNANKPFNSDSGTVTAEQIANYVTAVVVDEYGTSYPTDFGFALLKNGNITSGITYSEYTNNKSAYSVKITYGGVSATLSLSQLEGTMKLFDEVVSDHFEVNVSGAKVKDYIDGEMITDFTGIVLTVYDSSNTVIKEYKGSEIAKSGLVQKTAFSAKETSVIFEMNGTTMPPVTVNVVAAGFKIAEKQISSIKVVKNPTKTSYTAGEKLDLSGLELQLVYNSGTTETISYKNVDCYPENGTVLTAENKNVHISYEYAAGKSVNTDIAITVKSAGKTVKSISLTTTRSAKTEYFVGEKFNGEYFEVTLTYSDYTTKKEDLSSLSFTVDEKNCDSNKIFTSEWKAPITIKLTNYKNADGDNITLETDTITVTKRPNLESIVASTNKVSFMEGDMPKVKDFTITVKYDDKSQRVFQVAEDDTNANKSTYTMTTGSGTGSVTYTVKLTPTTIDSETKTIRVTYSEKLYGSVTVTKYDDIEIEVTVPDAILTYYDNTTGVKAYVSKAYEDFYEALKDAEDIADEYGSTYTSSYYSRVPEIQLRRDVIMSYDFDTTEDLKIDLNGHNLTMIRGELSVSTKAPNDTQVIFTNTADTDAKLIYSTSDDDTIIIAEDESFNIDRSSGSNKGKYDVTISSVKNGKVDGPREVTHGHDAKFTITPDEDYKIKSISVKQDKSTKKYTEKDGVVTVEDVQGALTITVTFEEKAWDNPFTDVYKSATYYKSIQFVYENGLFSGMSATKFEPDTTMTRAMFVTVLGRLAGVDTSKYTKAPNFTDVSTSDQSISYAIPYIQWATEKGLIEGYGNGKFGPKDNITHIQMYVLMQRYASAIELKNTGATSTSIPANDVSDIPTWAGAYEAVQYAAKYDFLVTSSNRITPNGDAKRSELAMLLEKFCDKVLDWEK